VRLGLLLEQTLAPVPGGTGRFAFELAEALVRTAKNGDRVDGWTAWHRDVSAARANGVDLHRFPLPRRALIAAWERERGPAPRDADVVHATTLLIPPRVSPLVVTIHDPIPWTHPETLTPRGVAWHRAMGELAVRRADLVAVHLEAMKTELLDALPDLDPDRVAVLGAGVGASLRQQPSADRIAVVRRCYDLPERYVLSLATLEPRKGLDLLLAALAELPEPRPPLVLVGQPGWGGIDPLTEARRVGLPESAVRMLGKVPDADLAVVLRDATVLAAPSRAEGFGLPVAEAMCVGTAVVCSDAPALVEVAGDAAVIVARGDVTALSVALERMLADDDERTLWEARGLARSAAFDWDQVGHRAWELYRRVAIQAPR